jgi:hypothetical protein
MVWFTNFEALSFLQVEVSQENIAYRITDFANFVKGGSNHFIIKRKVFVEK